jgi:hypothetical protein
MRCGSICAKLKAIQLASDREYALSSMSYDANHESLEVRHEAALFSKNPASAASDAVGQRRVVAQIMTPSVDVAARRRQ